MTDDIVVPDSSSAVALIREALAAGANPEHLRELLAVRREWEADEARKQFNLAVSDFQRRCPIVEKGDNAHNKEYARMDRIWRTIRPLLTELGLSVTFQVCELREQLCHVEGQLRHRAGHGEKLVQDIPLPEKVQGQNLAQQAGSASTYAKRYALTAALGIVTGDDDDGHAAGTKFVTHAQAMEIGELVDACRGLPDFNEPALWKWAGAEYPQEVAFNRFDDVVAALRRKLGGGQVTTFDSPQRSPEWFERRRGLPTCSRFDQIVTAVRGAPSKAQDTLIDTLIAESICPPDEGVIKYTSPEIEQGIRLEAEARCAYELEFAAGPVRECGFVLADCGLYGGSPDALVGESGGVEIKCPAPATHIGYLRAGVLPNDYKCQVHGYMVVTGRKWWDFFSYARHLPPFRLRVEADDFTALLAAELQIFCVRYNAARAQFKLPPIGAKGAA